MNPLLIITLILLVVSGIGLIVFILLHSGKGTGISDMIASSVYSTQTGTSIVEKNLDRITIAFAIIFMLSLLFSLLLFVLFLGLVFSKCPNFSGCFVS